MKKKVAAIKNEISQEAARRLLRRAQKTVKFLVKMAAKSEANARKSEPPQVQCELYADALRFRAVADNIKEVIGKAKSE